MFTDGMQLFIQLSAEPAQRVLHPAAVVSPTDGGCVAALHLDDPAAVTPRQPVRVYYHRQRQFLQQPASVDAVMPPDAARLAPAAQGPVLAGAPSVPPNVFLGLHADGEPASADTRQCYRVSTLFTELTAAVGDEPRCKLLDVSATGCSIIASGGYDIGTVLRVTLRHGGATYTGAACVQCVKALPDGRVRYGLHTLQAQSPNDTLAKGQRTISMAVQREQLRRMTATG